MDYLEFYGLEEEPFSSAPINKFYYNSTQHQRALVRLMYAVDSMKGLAVLIGEVGTGKTTLARRMLDSLPEEGYESALLVIIHSGITADWLLSRIARQLGVEDPAPEKLKLLNQLYNRLLELNEEGKKAVVLIDEAQMLHSKELMEEFRGLLNLELPESKLITFVFFGLPDLEDSLKLDEPLAQRVALQCKLDSFNFESTEGYVNHRLRLAGAKNQLFNSDSIRLIHHYSRGIPRLINTICDNCLFEGYLLKKKSIEPELVQSVVTDLGLIPMPKPPGHERNQGEPGQVIKPPTPFRAGHLPPPHTNPEAAHPDTEDITERHVSEEETGAPQQAPSAVNVPPPPVPPAAPSGQSQPANGEDIDAMLEGLTDSNKRQQQSEEGEEEENLDSLFDNIEDK